MAYIIYSVVLSSIAYMAANQAIFNITSRIAGI